MTMNNYPGKQFNNTFRGCEPSDYNACVGVNGYPDYTEYANGFSDAALHLIDAAIEFEKMDELIYPICFNMRHSFELRLKQFTFALSKIRDQINLDDFNDTKLHDLSEIWCYYKKKASEVDGRIVEKLAELEPIVSDFSEVDPTGQTFRYPYCAEKKAKKKHLKEVAIINVKHLKDVFSKLRNDLQEVHDLNQSLSKEYRTGTYTKKLSRYDLVNIAKKLPAHRRWQDSLPMCLEVKQRIREEYDISSGEFGKAKSLIELNYELAAEIGIELPLKVSKTRDWIEVNKAYVIASRGEWNSSVRSTCILASSDIAIGEVINLVQDLAEATRYCLEHISIEAFIDIASVYEYGRYTSYCEDYTSYFNGEKNIAKAHYLAPDERFEYIRNLLKKNNFKRYIFRGLKMLKQRTILVELGYELPTYDVYEIVSGAFAQIVVKKDGVILERSPLCLTGSEKHKKKRREIDDRYLTKSISMG